jgi:RNase P subunit RPR2
MPIQIQFQHCLGCNKATIHAEDRVNDKESATIWHCLNCGREHRPEEPGTPNEKSKNIPPKPILPQGIRERIVYK